MIKKSKLTRYSNLIKSIKDWQKYLSNKWVKKDPILYTTRKEKLRFEVPSNLGGIFKEIFFDEFYSLSHIKNKVNQSSTVFDIGTNAGYFTVFILEKINPKEVHCFEPFPNNFELLKRNIHRNEKINSKVHLNQKAVVGSDIKNIELYFNENNSFSPTASAYQGLDTVNKKINVQAINLEKYFTEHNIQRIDLLKMDCEGAEYDIFYNLPQEFFSRINCIYMETHDMDTNKNNTTSLVLFFGQLGYKTEITPIDGKTAMVWVEKGGIDS